MRTPKRKSEENRKRYTGPIEITQAGLDGLKEEVLELEASLPALLQELTRTREMGDLSENAAYQTAKYLVRSTQGKIRRLQSKIKRAVVIKKTKSDNVQLGSTVTLQKDGKEFVFEILGPQETNPSSGRISHKSPLGKALMGNKVGDTIELKLEDRMIVYKLIKLD